MAKGYWVTWYRSVSDPAAHAEYAALAGPVIQALGGRFLVRGKPAIALEGMAERCVVIEFDSVATAEACYRSEAYQAALSHLRGAERELRIFETS